MKRQNNHPGAPCSPHGLRGLFSIFIGLFVLVPLFFCSCGQKEKKEARNHVSKPADFNASNYVIGVVSETNSCFEAKRVFPDAKFREFETITDAYPALENGTIDAIAYDRPVLDYAQRSRDVFVLMPDNYADGHVAIAIPESKPALLQTVNAFLQEYFTSGLYDNM